MPIGERFPRSPLDLWFRRRKTVYILMFIVVFICYLAAFMVHSSRSLTRWELGAPWGQRLAWVGFALHTWHLFWVAKLAVADHGAPLSNWHDWCLVGAWLVAAAYLIAGSTGAQDWQGVSLLPLVLGLLAIAQIFPQEDAFASAKAYRLWGLLHGCCLLLGTVATSLGFSSGIMYLIQANRLKRKLAPFASVRLPTLETLERSNEQLFVWSVFFLVAGILAGVILNLVAEASPMPWTDPTIIISSVLLFWLIGAGVFASVYRPARVGRKVAYLTVSSFLFLALTLAFVWFSQTDHARRQAVSVQDLAPSRHASREICPVGRQFSCLSSTIRRSTIQAHANPSMERDTDLETLRQ